LGYNIGDFVTDASGHPDPHHKKREKGDFEWKKVTLKPNSWKAT
jgi:hypothetical protein